MDTGMPTLYQTKRTSGNTATISKRRHAYACADRWLVRIHSWACGSVADYVITGPEGQKTHGWDNGPYSGRGIAMKTGIANAMELARKHPYECY